MMPMTRPAVNALVALISSPIMAPAVFKKRANDHQGKYTVNNGWNTC